MSLLTYISCAAAPKAGTALPEPVEKSPRDRLPEPRTTTNSAFSGPQRTRRSLRWRFTQHRRMSAPVDIVRFSNPDAMIAHCLLPAWEADEYVSISRPASIAVSFTYQRRATVQLLATRRVERNIPQGSFGTAGEAPIAWIRVREPSECLEVTASTALRASIAEDMHVPQHRNLDDCHGGHDPIVWVITARLRSIMRSGLHDPLEIETLVRKLYARVFALRFGGRPSVRGDGGLSTHRLTAVTEWIDAHLGGDITIARLAAVASLSPAHFIRSFKRSVGVSPHQYVRARRMERARDQLARGESVATAAHSAAFASVSQFRKAFFDTFGHPPHASPRRGRRRWLEP